MMQEGDRGTPQPPIVRPISTPQPAIARPTVAPVPAPTPPLNLYEYFSGAIRNLFTQPQRNKWLQSADVRNGYDFLSGNTNTYTLWPAYMDNPRAVAEHTFDVPRIYRGLQATNQLTEPQIADVVRGFDDYTQEFVRAPVTRDWYEYLYGMPYAEVVRRRPASNDELAWEQSVLRNLAGIGPPPYYQPSPSQHQVDPITWPEVFTQYEPWWYGQG